MKKIVFRGDKDSVDDKLAFICEVAHSLGLDFRQSYESVFITDDFTDALYIHSCCVDIVFNVLMETLKDGNLAKK